MELTRRDALVAAMGAGIGVSGGAVLAVERAERGESSSVGTSESSSAASASVGSGSETDLPATFVAVARAIYPSAVEGIGEFVRTYVRERFEDRPRRVGETARELNALANGRHGASITALDPGTVETLLTKIGADTAVADPSGTISQRVRYHLVNELQYALYTSPTGGTLAGIENPIGYPGGIASYQRGPSA